MMRVSTLPDLPPSAVSQYLGSIRGDFVVPSAGGRDAKASLIDQLALVETLDPHEQLSQEIATIAKETYAFLKACGWSVERFGFQNLIHCSDAEYRQIDTSSCFRSQSQ